VFGYSSFFGLKWPDVGSPDEGEVLLETHEEASEYRDSALGTSPALTTADGCTSEAQAVLQPDRTAEPPAPSPAGTGPLDSTVTGTGGACEPEGHVVDTPLPRGQNIPSHSPAQVARGQAGTDSRDGGLTIGKPGGPMSGCSAITPTIMTTSPSRSAPSVFRTTTSKRKDGAGSSRLRKKVRERLRSVFTRAKSMTGIRVPRKALIHSKGGGGRLGRFSLRA
jgi:hypothetical protein